MTPELLLQRATDRHRAGDLREARELYLQVLAAAPGHPVASFRCGLLELQDKRPAAALDLIEHAVRTDPAAAQHHLGHGQVLQALGRSAAAADAYRRALALEPDSADTQFALGGALQAAGELAAAMRVYESLLALQPTRADAWNNLGICLQRSGEVPAAAAAYKQALALQPADARTLSNLGAAMLALGEVESAVGLQRRALELQPTVISHVLNLAIALCAQRDFTTAETLLRGVLTRDPAQPEVAFNLAVAVHGLGRLPESAVLYRRAIELRPGYADAFNNLGNVEKELGEFSAAEAAYAAAIASRPGWAVAMNNAGCLLRTLGRLEEAESQFREALLANPRHAALYDNLGSVLKDSGELDAAIECYRRSLEIDASGSAAHSNLVYALSFQSATPEPILAEARRWNERFALPLYAPGRRPDGGPADAQRRLRIGYVSADFRDHCQSLFTIPLFANHDREAVEIYCYSSVTRADQFTRRISGYAAVWRDVHALDDAALAAAIRADGIDILVDLTMHMANGRPLLFARRPAPVQIAWLAYPGTTGMDAMDFRLSDRYLDPPAFDAHYSEKTLRLPDSFWCYDPLHTQPAVSPLPALLRGHVTFGCLNNPCKLTDATLRLWSGVLGALPDSRLVMLARAGRQRDSLLKRLGGYGITAERVRFVPFQPRADYLRAYRDIDIGLDTLPYNGHTTSLDSLWMGVPVISRIGQTCVGRGGLSQLSQIDLGDLAALGDDAFTAAALELAADLPRLAALRASLRTRLEASPLMDAARFARGIEAAYRRAWHEHSVRQDSDSSAQPR